MANITTRNLDDDVKTRHAGAGGGQRPFYGGGGPVFLRDTVGRKPRSRNLASIVRSHFGPDNGVDL